MAKFLKLSSIVIFVFFSLPFTLVFAKDLGVVGAVYPIAERDALSELEERAKQVKWDNYINKKKLEKQVKNYKPEDLQPLPRAKKDNTYSVDMTYTLEFDIPDGKGGILYPKGYSFNPLDYVSYPVTLVFIDGGDKEQIKWLKKSGYNSDINARVLLVDGSYSEISEQLGRPVFYSNKKIAERFNLRFVPSVVRQKGTVMEVKEIQIEREKK